MCCIRILFREFSLHSDTQFWFRTNQSSLLIVSAACLEIKRQIPIFQSFESRLFNIFSTCIYSYRYISLTQYMEDEEQRYRNSSVTVDYNLIHASSGLIFFYVLIHILCLVQYYLKIILTLKNKSTALHYLNVYL